MDKLFILLMVVLFAVGLTNQTIFDDKGMQSDAIEMKNNTQKIIKEANDQMGNFSTSTPTAPTTTP